MKRTAPVTLALFWAFLPLVCFGASPGEERVRAAIPRDQTFEVMINDPLLASVHRIMLSTNDAHSLYERHGFKVIGGDDEEGRQTMQLKR